MGLREKSRCERFLVAGQKKKAETHHMPRRQSVIHAIIIAQTAMNVHTAIVLYGWVRDGGDETPKMKLVVSSAPAQKKMGINRTPPNATGRTVTAAQ